MLTNRRSKTPCKRDIELSDKDQGNDNEKLMILIDEHEPLLRHIIGLDVHNSVDIDDVFQETLLAILEHFRTGKPVKYPKAWMVKIAKSKCVDFH